MQDHFRGDDFIQPQNIAPRPFPPPHHRRDNFEREDDGVPPELPPPLRQGPRNDMRYSVGNALGNAAVNPGQIPASPPAAAPPRSRRNIRRPAAVEGAPAANDVPIHQLVDGGRVMPAPSNHSVRLPAMNARNGGGVVSADGSNGSDAAARAMPPSVIGGAGRHAPSFASRGVRASQAAAASAVAYDAGPRPPRDRSRGRLDQA
jgi:hypothetical protein